MRQTWLDTLGEAGAAKPEKHWGKAGAGLMLFLNGRVLLLKRSGSVDQPNTWGIPGGAATEGWHGKEQIKASDTPSEAALFEVAQKETREEIGILPAFDKFGVVTYKSGNFVFKTFLGKVDGAKYQLKDDGKKWQLYAGDRLVTPKLDWENSDWRWFKTHEVAAKATPLHFGVEYVMEKRPGLFKNVDHPAVEARMGRLLDRLTELADTLKGEPTTQQREMLQKLVGRANRALRRERTLTPGSVGIEPGPEWEGVSLGDTGSLLGDAPEVLLQPQHIGRITARGLRLTVQSNQVWAWRPRKIEKAGGVQ